MSDLLCRMYSATCIGLEVVKVTVEVSITPGIGIFIIGLPDSAVREALLRVTTSLQRSGYRIPGRKMVINMAPANIRKEGSGYDAAIAAGVLFASGQALFLNPSDYLIVGELSLNGEFRPVPGMLPIAVKASEMGFKYMICPAQSAGEVSVAGGVTVYGVSDLKEMIAVLQGEESAENYIVKECRVNFARDDGEYDFAFVKGQKMARRGVEIAACGGHNIMLSGPPGAGKSLIAKCIATILPPLGREESLETGMIYSVAGLSDASCGLMTRRPFRSPHHTASMVSVVGGGTCVLPGEISLAHNGVLYLDEIAQYPRALLDMLRQPLEERKVTISRARYKVTYPCSFMLVASMNPCPCGYAGEEGDRCNCSRGSIERYLSRISGPLLDRIDINIRVHPVESDAILSKDLSESSAAIAERVRCVRDVQMKRFEGTGIYLNAQMTPPMLDKYCPIGKEESDYLRMVMDRYRFSARVFSRILKLSRTIADMKGEDFIKKNDISEAVQYRFQEFV